MPNLRILSLLLLLLSCGEPQATEQTSATDNRPPNVIIIFADDLGYGDLSCYGHPTIQTPRLDQMAREGFRLTSFYAAAAVCSPSRAALLTGRYSTVCGMPGNKGPDSPDGLPQEEITLAELLQEEDYQTACFGKWHLGAVEGFFPTDNGFDEYYGILYSNDMEPPWVNTERPLQLYRDKTPTSEYPVDQTTLTERYTQEAIRFIREQQEAPFFLYLPHAMPHLPIATSERFSGQSAGGLFGDVIETLDWSVGAILDVLEEEGLSENTLVIFTSDNGPWNRMPPRMYETEAVEKWHAGTAGPLRGSKATTWEGGFRVPCILRWPGQITADRSSSELLSTLDIYPTVAALAGARLPADREYHGQDEIAFLRGESSTSKRESFYYLNERVLEGVREGDWKLVYKPDEEGQLSARLYNLSRDPYEWHNVAANHQEIVASLERMLQQASENLMAPLHF